MEELDLKNILHIIMKRKWIIVLTVFLCTLAAGAISFFVQEPVYQSDTTLYIGKNVDSSTSSTDLAYNDVMLSAQLVKDYNEIVRSRLVANQVMEDLKIKDISVDQFIRKLSVNQKNDTHIILISATDSNPKTARTIADKVAEVFRDKVVDIMQVDNVIVIDTAEVPEAPIKPDKKMNVVLGFMLGLMLGLGITFLIEFFDNTVKTTEDIKKYLDLPVIGTIPVFPEN